MKTELLCAWLALPGKTWPPDPHVLLDVALGEKNAQRIEEQVHARMAKLRSFQLSHPEEATEGMNRVAQAFLALMEAALVAPTPKSADPPAGLTESGIQRWKETPPPVRSTSDSNLSGTVITAKPVAPGLNFRSLDLDEPAVREFAENASEATKGLVTLADVIERADRTRDALIVWRKVGEFMAPTGKKNTQLTVASRLPKLLEELDDVMTSYPAFMGRPGKPGYRVVGLAQLAMSPEVFLAMDNDQRRLLASDWSNGHKILLAHRRFLLRQFRTLRGRNRAIHGFRKARYLLNEHAGLLLLLVSAMVGVAFATWWWFGR